MYIIFKKHGYLTMFYLKKQKIYQMLENLVYIIYDKSGVYIW